MMTQIGNRSTPVNGKQSVPEVRVRAIPHTKRSASVRVTNLRKQYSKVVALAGISFEAYPGDVIGILGPNGAGKSTLVEILFGLAKLDSGSAFVLDADVRFDMKHLRHRMGIVTQEVALPPLLTVAEIVTLHATYHEVAREPARLLQAMGLTEKRNALVKSLSGGLHQRLAVALALLGEPELLFLDEPTSALDPLGRASVWKLLLEPTDNPRTILLTTHRMEEAEQLCTKVAILDRGEMLDFGSPKDLVARHCPGHVVHFRTDAPADFGDAAEAMVIGEPHEGARPVTVRTEHLQQILEMLVAAQLRRPSLVEDLRVERSTLEDVFFKLTKRGEAS